MRTFARGLAAFLAIALLPATVLAKQVTVKTSDLTFDTAKEILLSHDKSLTGLADEAIQKILENKGSLTFDDKVLSADVRGRLESAQKVSAVTQTLQTGKEWAGIGKEVGAAVADTARALSVETNEFVKTPVGKWTAVILLIYFLGAKLWTLWTVFAGIVVWVVLGVVIVRSWRYYHARSVTTKKEGGETTTVTAGYDFQNSDLREVSFALHGIAFVALNVVMMIIVL